MMKRWMNWKSSFERSNHFPVFILLFFCLPLHNHPITSAYALMYTMYMYGTCSRSLRQQRSKGLPLDVHICSHATEEGIKWTDMNSVTIKREQERGKKIRDVDHGATTHAHTHAYVFSSLCHTLYFGILLPPWVWFTKIYHNMSMLISVNSEAKACPFDVYLTLVYTRHSILHTPVHVHCRYQMSSPGLCLQVHCTSTCIYKSSTYRVYIHVHVCNMCRVLPCIYMYVHACQQFTCTCTYLNLQWPGGSSNPCSSFKCWVSFFPKENLELQTWQQ